jgi:hypothetical protein
MTTNTLVPPQIIDFPKTTNFEFFTSKIFGLRNGNFFEYLKLNSLQKFSREVKF